MKNIDIFVKYKYDVTHVSSGHGSWAMFFSCIIVICIRSELLPYADISII